MHSRTHQYSNSWEKAGPACGRQPGRHCVTLISIVCDLVHSVSAAPRSTANRNPRPPCLHCARAGSCRRAGRAVSVSSEVQRRAHVRIECAHAHPDSSTHAPAWRSCMRWPHTGACAGRAVPRAPLCVQTRRMPSRLGMWCSSRSSSRACSTGAGQAHARRQQQQAAAAVTREARTATVTAFMGTASPTARPSLLNAGLLIRLGCTLLSAEHGAHAA